MKGIELIEAERKRQIEVEGFDADHDKSHNSDALAVAAAHYAMPESARTFMMTSDHKYLPIFWPFEAEWWKPCPGDRIKELVKAGALIAAEIDRLIEQDEFDK